MKLILNFLFLSISIQNCFTSVSFLWYYIPTCKNCCFDNFIFKCMHKILDVNICCSFYQCKYEYANLIIRYGIKKKKILAYVYGKFFIETM